MPVTQWLYNTGAGEVVFQLIQQTCFLFCLFWQLAFEPPSCPWTELSQQRASAPLSAKRLLLLISEEPKQSSPFPLLLSPALFAHTLK